jgi:hypothetical protein
MIDTYLGYNFLCQQAQRTVISSDLISCVVGHFVDDNVMVLFMIKYLVIKILVTTETVTFIRELSCSKGSELGVPSYFYSEGSSG